MWVSGWGVEATMSHVLEDSRRIRTERPVVGWTKANLLMCVGRYIAEIH